MDKNQKSPDLLTFEKIWIHPSFSFWVSPVKSLEEISNIEDKDKRDKFLDIFNKLNKTSPITSLSIGNLARFNGHSTQDLNLTKIIELMHKSSPYYKKRQLSVVQNDRGKMITNDAFHIYYAWKAGCNFLLTTDDKTLIKRVNRNRIKFDSIIGNMKIVNPVTLVELLKL